MYENFSRLYEKFSRYYEKYSRSYENFSRYYENFSRSYEKYSRPYKKFSRYYEKVSRSYENFSRYYEKYSRYYENFSRLYEKIPRYNEKIFRTYEKYSRSYEKNNFFLLLFLTLVGFRKVYLFYGSHFKPYNLPFPRKKEDIWALIHEESPRNAYILSHNETMNIFNITSTYSRNSNYPVTTQWLQCSDWLEDTEFLVSLEAKNKLRRRGMAPVLYLHSDCGVPSDRDHYVKMLQKYMKVDSYGTCLMNKKLPERLAIHSCIQPPPSPTHTHKHTINILSVHPF